MELQLYLDIIRRRWPIVVAVPLLTLVISLAAALTRPVDYGTTLRLLATRGTTNPENKAGLTAQGEDQAASELPAVLSGRQIAADIAAEMMRRGRPRDPEDVRRAIHGANEGHAVIIGITTPDPVDGLLIAQIIVDLLKKNGLIYWGEPNATPERPGLNIAVLEMPAEAMPLNGPGSIAREVAVRTLAALAAGIGLAFALHYFDDRRPADAGSVVQRPSSIVQATKRSD